MHNQLIQQIEPWWVSRGWKLSTLQAKSHYQLLGIRQAMYKDLAKQLDKPIITAIQGQPQYEYQQMDLFN